MSRQIYRVPLDFDSPLDKVWPGYLMPEHLRPDPCPDCELGFSPQAQRFHDQWYGEARFDPDETGSEWLNIHTPGVRAIAERNTADAPDFCLNGRSAVDREATRLAVMWNGQWSHHLSQDDVDALIAADRLWDFTHTCRPGEGWQPIVPVPAVTAAQVNEWSLRGMGHDGLNAHAVIEARCAREGVPYTCATCGGCATFEAYPGQRAEAEAWERTEPPAGDGWQLWSTVTEGSPMSPVFETAEALANWMSDPARDKFDWVPFDVAMKFIDAGWAPSGYETELGMVSGVEFVGFHSDGER